MPVKDYHYFVSYSFVNTHGSGVGSAVSSFSKPLEYMSDVRMAEQAISQGHLPGTRITITNWIPIKGESRPE